MNFLKSLWGRDKGEPLIIQCSICSWQPDGGKHWRCTCGHTWNTFKTKAKCPVCKHQWDKTWCPACGEATLHKSWYKTKKEIDEIEGAKDPVLLARKKRIEARLMSYGITTLRIKYLPYLDYSNEAFLTPHEAGCRMIILYAVAYLSHHLDERPQASVWLKEEKLWDSVSPSEKEFFESESVEQQTLDQLSWRIESALALGWSVNCLDALPRLDVDNNDEEIREFENNIPAIGDSTMLFLTKLEFRSVEEIYEETLLNELATTYFRDLLFNGRFDTSRINRHVSFERHQAFNWLRNFGWVDDHENLGEFWDEVDTST